jgi:PleD family two-component response regulator
MDQTEPTRIVAVVRDLFFAIRIRETLAPRGYAVAVAKTNDALDAALAEGPAALLIVDLAFTAIEPAALIARLKGDAASAAIPILAFGSHLDQTSRDAAKAAGADRVVANSKLAEALPDLVARYARPTAPTPTEG